MDCMVVGFTMQKSKRGSFFLFLLDKESSF